LVVATGGNLKEGFWGEILMEAALARGICGLVTDGAVRDTRALRERAFPVFCAGVAIPGTTKTISGTLHAPAMLMQVVVTPGDFVVGDDDGVVIIPRDKALPVLAGSQARTEKEVAMIQRLRQGELTIDLLKLGGATFKPKG
jgi:4-hydroxy-4-methyl-2-oxoglutarate aldolase